MAGALWLDVVRCDLLCQGSIGKVRRVRKGGVSAGMA